MTEMTMHDGWQAEAARAARKRRSAWIGSPALMATGIALVVGGVVLSGIGGAVAMALGGVLLVGGTVWGTAIYMRVIDEQERQANLWGCYVGMTAYLVLVIADRMLRFLGHPVPHGDDAIFFTTMTIVMAVFAWKRFR